MKNILLPLLALLIPGLSALADDTAKTPPPRWNIHVELLMADVPQAKALALLPELRDPGKIDDATSQILAAINSKEATLVGYPVLELNDGERGVSETILEKRYPTEFESPSSPQNSGSSQQSESHICFPDAFETRNVGTTLEAEAHVFNQGNWIHLNLVPQDVRFQGFDTYDVLNASNGAKGEVKQPKFHTTKVTTSLDLPNGQRRLLAFHKLAEPADQIEIYILQAWAEPIK